MLRGILCIGSNVDGILKLLAPEDIIPPADPEALSARIEEVLTDTVRLERMAKRDSQSAKEYYRSKPVPRLVEFHRKMAFKQTTAVRCFLTL